jgi:hypothetical protein
LILHRRSFAAADCLGSRPLAIAGAMIMLGNVYTNIIEAPLGVRGGASVPCGESARVVRAWHSAARQKSHVEPKRSPKHKTVAKRC